MLTDIEIAQAAEPKRITEIAERAGVDEKYLECYGKYKAKVDYNLLREEDHTPGKLVLVTAINPTPAGEGKTTTTVGLADALSLRGKNVMVALARAPSRACVRHQGAAPPAADTPRLSEDINLHFTGDFHAIGAANNLLAALLDAHIQQRQRTRHRRAQDHLEARVVDMNDRQLRNIVDGLGGKAHGVPREDGFDITVASEVMAIFCLATSITDLKDAWGASSSATPTTTNPSPRTICMPRARWRAAEGRASSPTWCRRSRARRRSCTAAHSQTSRMAATPSWPRAWPWRSATTASPRRASAPIWVRRSSWTSSAARRG